MDLEWEALKPHSVAVLVLLFLDSILVEIEGIRPTVFLLIQWDWGLQSLFES